jgi:hypothetical protein
MINPNEVGRSRFIDFIVDGINCKKVIYLIRLDGRKFVISKNIIAINNRNTMERTILIFLRYDCFNISHYFSEDRELI